MRNTKKPPLAGDFLCGKRVSLPLGNIGKLQKKITAQGGLQPAIGIIAAVMKPALHETLFFAFSIMTFTHRLMPNRDFTSSAFAHKVSGNTV
ncbi:hypothetical protein [uncultured Cardiobacterium sp.]|uniref:hypothetical protein n=1 Tax=uncultured Cardiobacterium sp. TaxID=417619 RepID=UPI00262BA1CC|nr:hypothetical protein [uncultured Cardiobacterium sp.]